MKSVLLFSCVYVLALPYDHIVLINFGAHGLVKKDPSIANDDTPLTAHTLNNKNSRGQKHSVKLTSWFKNSYIITQFYALSQTKGNLSRSAASP